MNKFLWRFVRKNPSFTGNYSSVEEANHYCKGYGTEEIFEKVKAAALAVKNNEACYERDSSLFYTYDTNYNLLMYLYRLAFRQKKPIGVLDWGGSLGSTYFQHRKLLLQDQMVNNWTVIEQPHFVEFGKNKLEDDVLRFEHTDIQSVDISKYQCILFSAVLHYLKDYQSIINKICSCNIETIILERTPVCQKEMICIEQVKEPIYNAAYAMQIFCEKNLKSLFVKKGYTLVDEWKSLVDSPIYVNGEFVEFKSFIFEKEIKL